MSLSPRDRLAIAKISGGVSDINRQISTRLAIEGRGEDFSLEKAELARLSRQIEYIRSRRDRYAFHNLKSISEPRVI